jgi:hypothetical protein
MVRAFPDRDPEGFVPLEELRQKARTLSRKDFTENCPAPGLIIRPAANPSATDAEEEGGQLHRLLTVEFSAVQSLRYLNRVGLVVKRAGSVFSGLIYVGRAPSNDLVLSVGSVSKLHGYFQCKTGEWSFTDHRSTNGTSLNGQKFASGAERPLESGDQLGIGSEISALFLLPESLYDKLRQGTVP